LNKLKGKAHIFGADIDTDAILPAGYMNITEARELARHCMEGADPDFARKVKTGDMIVADKNFGCGSSREHAPIAIKAAGVSCIIAKSFARIFYRNAINIGLPILESEEVAARIRPGDELEIDLASGHIVNLRSREEFFAMPFPPFMQDIINSGGLINYLKQRTT